MSLVTLILLSFLFLTLCFISFTPDITSFILCISSTTMLVAFANFRASSFDVASGIELVNAIIVLFHWLVQWCERGELMITSSNFLSLKCSNDRKLFK